MERKSMDLELKDMSKEKRTAVIAHAVYNNIDRMGDIATKGMFTKSWKEYKSIDFLFNHAESEIPGKVVRTFEDEEKAYTEVKFGNWKLGDDVLEMADQGVLRGASFGFVTEKKDFVDIKGKKVRKLKEVIHTETSLLTKKPANPLAGIVELRKSFEGLELKTLSQPEQAMLKQIIAGDQSVLEKLVSLSGSLEPTSDLYTWINYNIERRSSLIGDIRYQLKYNSGELKEFQSYISTLEKFCKNSNASDDCIMKLQYELEEAKAIIQQYDTADTPLEQSASGNEEAFADQLYLLTLKTF